MSTNKQIAVSKRKLLLAFISIALICSIASSSVVYVMAQGGATPITISSGSYPGAATATIFVNSGTYYAKNPTGAIITSGSSLSTVIAACTSGGEVLLLAGAYTLDASISVTSPNVWLTGEGKDTVITLANAVNDDMIHATGANIHISDLKLLGNGAQQSAGAGIYLDTVTNGLVDNVEVTNTFSDGVKLNASNDTKVINSWFESNGYTGIYSTGYSYRTEISNNHVVGSTNWGIDCYQSPNAIVIGNNVRQTSGGRDHNDCIVVKDSNNTIVSNNRCQSAGDTGIAVITSNNCVISDNVIDKAWYNGIYLMGAQYCNVQGNTISDCSQKTVGTWSAISLEIEPFVPRSALYNNIQNNFCIEGQTVPTMKHGVTEDATADYNVIKNNFFDSRLIGVGGVYPAWNALYGYTKGVYQNGIHSTVIQNKGFVTENSGVANITSGNTAVAVTHGCNYVPNPGDINIHLIAPCTNDPIQIFVRYLDSTTFTIGVATDPGASGASFAWSVIRQAPP